MDFLTSDPFVTIFSVVGSAIGLFLALRADIGKRIDRVERRIGQRIDRVEEGLGQRIDRVEEGLGQRIDRVEEGLGQRIDRVEEGLGKRTDRVEDRARADHLELVAEIGELKTAVGVLGAKLDERSAPQRLVVQEPRGDYKAGDEPEDDPEA